MKPKVIVVCGPTATGKSKTAIEIAKKFDGEIISADSMQIYKGLDIGTAKITEEEMSGIRHHMIDICEPDYDYTVAEFQSEAKHLIADITGRNKMPVVCGGTGLYIHSLLYDIDFISDPNQSYREFLESKSEDELFLMLKEKDPESCNRIHKNDKKRMVRRLEILHGTDTKDFDFRKPCNDYDFISVCLNTDRDILYERIDTRVDKMISDGLVSEVRDVYERIGDTPHSMKAIGYKEIIAYFKDLCTLDMAISDIKQNSRRYAKRQVTWFKREYGMEWFDINDIDYIDQTICYIEKFK